MGMDKHQESTNLSRHERLDTGDILWGLLSHKDILFLRKSFRDQQVVSFCLWVEDRIFSHILPEFRIKRFIDRIRSDEKLLFQDIAINNPSYRCLDNLIDSLLKLLNRKSDLLATLLDFFYSHEVLKFYRGISEILAPVLEIDIITIARKIEKSSFSEALKRKIEERIRMEFAYWTERFVGTWYKDISEDKTLNIKRVPMGPIAEYDLITALMLQFPEKCYWNQEDYNAV
jgi:hypothetical protein